MAVDKQAIEKIMSSMGQGIVYVDSDKRIQMCNSYAKKITGIIIDAMCSHEGGRLDEGDIVIIADNKIGEDDGETGHDAWNLRLIRRVYCFSNWKGVNVGADGRSPCLVFAVYGANYTVTGNACFAVYTYF